MARTPSNVGARARAIVERDDDDRVASCDARRSFAPSSRASRNRDNDGRRSRCLLTSATGPFSRIMTPGRVPRFESSPPCSRHSTTDDRSMSATVTTRTRAIRLYRCVERTNETRSRVGARLWTTRRRDARDAWRDRVRYPRAIAMRSTTTTDRLTRTMTTGWEPGTRFARCYRGASIETSFTMNGIACARRLNPTRG